MLFAVAAPAVGAGGAVVWVCWDGVVWVGGLDCVGSLWFGDRAGMGCGDGVGVGWGPAGWGCRELF